MKKIIVSLFVVLSFTACDSTKFLETVNDVLESSTGGGGVSNIEIGAGLKEALAQGIKTGADAVSKTDGYLKNPQIRIPWPQEVQKVANTLQSIGLGGAVTKVETSLNRAAEKAAKEAKPIFISAISQLTFQDVMAILKGEQNAATDFLRRTTTSQLTAKFNPVISNALKSVKATQHWDEAITKYNSIPLVNKVTLDLPNYVTGQALDGLFLMIEKEEAKIRKDPLARSTDLLKKVFKLQD